jgi:hypothetical protein
VSFEDDLRQLCGNPAGEGVQLAAHAMRRIENRARLRDRFDPARNTGNMRRGIDKATLALEIAMAIRSGDTPRAQQLIEAGATLFGSGPLIAEVGMQSAKLEESALAGYGSGPAAVPQHKGRAARAAS